MNELPDFRDQVLDLVRRVPPGRLVTYGQIARILGRPKSARQVGAALASLTAIDGPVPWQRVVDRSGRLSPRSDLFGSSDPVAEHRRLLLDEGLATQSDQSFCLTTYGLSDTEVRELFPQEMLELVDLDNQVIGIAARPLVRRHNLLHRGVGILCWNKAGELYVHQRTASKDLFPSYYDMMVGGALEAGEDYPSAALREVQEELGVGRVTPKFLLETLYDGEKNRSFIQLFEVQWDGPITPQVEEIQWGQWMSFEQVLRWMNEVPIVPDGKQVFEDYLSQR